MRTLLALYICIYILFIYEERPHNVDLYNVCLFFSYGTLAAASSKKHRKSSFYLQYIYIYFFMYKGEKSVFVLALCVHLRLHISYHEVKIDPKNLSKARAQGMGNGGHFCPLCNRLQGYWKPGRTNLGAICQWAANDCPCMECGGPC